MTFAWTPYALPFLIASFLVGILALYVVKHRDTAVGPPFVALLSAITLWMLIGIDRPWRGSANQGAPG